MRSHLFFTFVLLSLSVFGAETIIAGSALGKSKRRGRSLSENSFFSRSGSSSRPTASPPIFQECELLAEQAGSASNTEASDSYGHGTDADSQSDDRDEIALQEAAVLRDSALANLPNDIFTYQILNLLGLYQRYRLSTVSRAWQVCILNTRMQDRIVIGSGYLEEILPEETGRRAPSPRRVDISLVIYLNQQVYKLQQLAESGSLITTSLTSPDCGCRPIVCNYHRDKSVIRGNGLTRGPISWLGHSAGHELLFVGVGPSLLVFHIEQEVVPELQLLGPSTDDVQPYLTNAPFRYLRTLVATMNIEYGIVRGNLLMLVSRLAGLVFLIDLKRFPR